MTGETTCSDATVVYRRLHELFRGSRRLCLRREVQ